MDKQMGQIELKETHLSLLIHFRSLFERINLRKNTYFYNQMKYNPISIPFYVIAQERKVLQITHTQQTIKQALLACQLVNYNFDTRQVQVYQIPCLKLRPGIGNESMIRTVQQFIDSKSIRQHIDKQYIKKQQNLQFLKDCECTMSKYPNQQGYYYLMMKPSNKKCDMKYLNKGGQNILIEIVKKINSKFPKQSQLQYKNQQLYEDIKEGISYMKKAKKQMINKHKMMYNMQDSHKNNFNGYSQTSNLLNENFNKYNRMNPLPIFVRKAIPSDDEEQEQIETKVQQTNQNYSEEKQQVQQVDNQDQYSKMNKQKKKTYSQKQSRDKPSKGKKSNNKKTAFQSKVNPPKQINKAPLFDQNDFPQLG